MPTWAKVLLIILAILVGLPILLQIIALIVGGVGFLFTSHKANKEFEEEVIRNRPEWRYR